MKIDCIGIVEVQYFAYSLEILDLMCKTADVKLLGHEKLLGGRLVMLTIGGKTDQVQAAIEAAKSSGRECIKMALAIANPHEEVLAHAVKKAATTETKKLEACQEEA